jgi:hypothetical protein
VADKRKNLWRGALGPRERRSAVMVERDLRDLSGAPVTGGGEPVEIFGEHAASPRSGLVCVAAWPKEAQPRGPH